MTQASRTIQFGERPRRSLSASIARETASRALQGSLPGRRLVAHRPGRARRSRARRIAAATGAAARTRIIRAVRPREPSSGRRVALRRDARIAVLHTEDRRCSAARRPARQSRPRALGSDRRREPAAGRAHRADRVGELREPRGAWPRRARSSPTSTRKATRASATTAAASSSTSPSSSRSTASRSCSTPTPPTCSRTPARRRTRRCSSRRSTPATRSSA